MITLKVIETMQEYPFATGGMQTWKPNLSETPINELQAMIEDEWQPYGYNYGILVKSTNTLHLFHSIN